MASGSDYNPYQAPEADEVPEPTPDVGHLTLASRPARFAAALLDGVLQLALLVPLQFAYGVFDGFPRMQPQGIGAELIWGAVSLGVFLLVNGYLLAKSGQSVGKRALGIRIVDAKSGALLPLWRLLTRRVLPQGLLGLIPTAGGYLVLVDVLYIFR